MKLYLYRNEDETGPYSEDEVRALVAGGEFTRIGLARREDMTGWQPLASLITLEPPSLTAIPDGLPPVPKRIRADAVGVTSIPSESTFPVRFGSAFAVDQLGFVGRGEIKPNPSGVTINGRRQWRAAARVGVFIVATPVMWFVLGKLGSVILHAVAYNSIHPISRHSALYYALTAFLGIIKLIGSPLVVFTLLPLVCASVTDLRIDRSQISEVVRRGRLLSFVVALTPAKHRKSRVRAMNDDAARTLAAALGPR